MANSTSFEHLLFLSRLRFCLLKPLILILQILISGVPAIDNFFWEYFTKSLLRFNLKFNEIVILLKNVEVVDWYFPPIWGFQWTWNSPFSEKLHKNSKMLKALWRFRRKLWPFDVKFHTLYFELIKPRKFFEVYLWLHKSI